MSVKFFIAPVEPSKWTDLPHLAMESLSDLKIHPDEYRQGLTRRFPMVTIRAKPTTGLFEWEFPREEKDSVGLQGCLQINGQIVEFGTGPKRSFLDYILWHRVFIPVNYPLYLFNSSSWDSLKLEINTNEQEIVKFTGIIV